MFPAPLLIFSLNVMIIFAEESNVVKPSVGVLEEIFGGASLFLYISADVLEPPDASIISSSPSLS